MQKGKGNLKAFSFLQRIPLEKALPDLPAYPVFNLLSVLERKISMRKPREELVKRGVLLEDPEQGESANELLLLLSVFGVTDLPLANPHPCNRSFGETYFRALC